MGKIEIVEASTLREALRKVFAKGLRPATIQEIYQLKKAKKIPEQWYDTGTLWYEGDFRQVTKNDAEHIDEVYAKKGRLLGLDGTNGGLYGGSLDDYGRFVGVAPEAPTKKKARKQR